MESIILYLVILALGGAEGCTEGDYSPHPTDCNKYYQCNHGEQLERSCSSGLYWNTKGRYCDWPENSGCIQGAKTSTQRTTVTPKTTTTPRSSKTTTRRGGIVTTTRSSIVIPPGRKLICYYTDWSWYRQNAGKYTPEDIDATLCTHIVYSFILLDTNTYTVKIADTWADIDNKFYEKVTSLKSQGVKVTVAVGGWTDSEGGKYSKLVNDPSRRASFISSIVSFIKQYNFDGIDLDWEYPKCWQGNCDQGPSSDKDGFAFLVRELRQALPPGAILSAAVSASRAIIPLAYDVPTLDENLDWIGVMDYDFHGPWDGKTGHIAPLYYKEGDTVEYYNIDSSIKTWIELGATPSKLIMGIPAYGKSFTLSNPSNNGLNAATSGAGKAGTYTASAGTLAYYEICSNKANWQVVQDPEGKIGPYAYNGDQWVSYDDPEMVREKIAYGKCKGLGGAMVWSLDFDDFKNICGYGRYPIITAIKQALAS